MSIGFHEIQDSVVIIRNKAVYKQTKAYERKGYIYVAAAGGFIIIRREGKTGHPNIAWDDIELPIKFAFDERGKMVKE